MNEITNTLLQFFTTHAHLLPNYVPNSQKVIILLWASKNNSFLLKIANQEYLGSARIDKNGRTYWKFKEWENLENEVPETLPSKGELENKESEVNPQSEPTPPELDPTLPNPDIVLPSTDIPNPSPNSNIAKWRERQKKTEQHAKSNNPNG